MDRRKGGGHGGTGYWGPEEGDEEQGEWAGGLSGVCVVETPDGNCL